MSALLTNVLGCPMCGSKAFDDVHDSTTPNHFGPPDVMLHHEEGCWFGPTTIIVLGPYEPGVSSNHVEQWNKRHGELGTGKVVRHPDGRTVKIKSGCYRDPVYGRVSNWWTWNEVRSDGSLGPDERGYGWST